LVDRHVEISLIRRGAVRGGAEAAAGARGREGAGAPAGAPAGARGASLGAGSRWRRRAAAPSALLALSAVSAFHCGAAPAAKPNRLFYHLPPPL